MYHQTQEASGKFEKLHIFLILKLSNSWWGLGSRWTPHHKKLRESKLTKNPDLTHFFSRKTWVIKLKRTRKVLSSRVFSLGVANVIYIPEVQPCFIGWRTTIFPVNLSPKKNRHVHFLGTGMSQDGEPPQPGYIEIGLNISCRPNQFIWNFCRDGLLVFAIFWFSVWGWHTLHKLERQRWTMWTLSIENLQFVVSIQL